jgi:hypothetical protein
MRFIKTHRLATGLAVAVAALALGGIAYATIPDSSGVIHGCYNVGNGALRVIDTGKGQTCTAGRETALTWNQTGPQGPVGPQGPAGPQGTAGPQGPAGTADAYARVAADGTVNPDFSKNVTSENVTHPQTGVYCIGGLTLNGQPWLPKIGVGNGVAGITGDGSGGLLPSPGDTLVTVGLLPNMSGDFTLGLCPDTATIRVETYSAANHAFENRSFSILFDD